MSFGALKVVNAAWIVWLLYWMATALRANKMREREPIWQRLAYLLVILAAGGLLLPARAGTYAQMRFQNSAPLRWLGAAITVAGVGFSMWARHHLGVYWSGMVGLREGHRLIRSGPYARIRHPIYTGILFGLAGSMLAEGTYGAVVVFAVVALGLSLKAKREEKLLTREFGPAFEEHRQHTGFLLPKFF